MPAIDLSDIPLVDNHCHGVLRDTSGLDLPRWRGLLTESSGERTRREFVATTLAYRRLVHHLARYFGCDATDTAVIRARADRSAADLTSALLRDANIEALVLDTGLPPAAEVFSNQETQQLGALRVAPLLRVEILMQELLTEVGSLGALEERLRDALRDVRAAGYVGLKSIVAYRTGLDIARWPREAVQAAFGAARTEVEQTGGVRIAHKPLLDTLLHLVFEQASRQELPVQFHTGYGDTDADMIQANPLYLRGILEGEPYPGMSVILLHESYPYTCQAGYMAAVYDRVYLDLSYAIPFLGYAEMESFTRAAFGVAPYAKLLYASDGVRLPELHWSSAIDGRRILGTVLGEMMDIGELSRADAERAGSAVLRDNAAHLYRL